MIKLEKPEAALIKRTATKIMDIIHKAASSSDAPFSTAMTVVDLVAADAILTASTIGQDIEMIIDMHDANVRKLIAEVEKANQ